MTTFYSVIWLYFGKEATGKAVRFVKLTALDLKDAKSRVSELCDHVCKIDPEINKYVVHLVDVEPPKFQGGLIPQTFLSKENFLDHLTPKMPALLA